MPPFLLLWLVCWTGAWSFMLWRLYCAWRGWPSAKGVVEAQGRHVGSGDPTRKIRLLDGPHQNLLSTMHLTEYDPPSLLPVGTIVDVKLSSKDASTCVEPGSDRHMLGFVTLFAVACGLPLVAAIWPYA